MMHVVLTEMGREINEGIERTGREWMVLLVELCGEERVWMIELLEKMWFARSRNYRVYI